VKYKSISSNLKNQKSTMKSFVNLYFACLFFAVFTFEAFADVKLPAIFSDNMVLQQQSQVLCGDGLSPMQA